MDADDAQVVNKQLNLLRNKKNHTAHCKKTVKNIRRYNMPYRPLRENIENLLANTIQKIGSQLAKFAQENIRKISMNIY